MLRNCRKWVVRIFFFFSFYHKLLFRELELESKLYVCAFREMKNPNDPCVCVCVIQQREICAVERA